jgi:predicted RND superfamily exporter protein
MLKGIAHEITLSIQARNGLSPAVAIWTALIAFAGLVAFVFLCVAAYAWLSLRFDAVIAGLIMAGIFAVVALVAALIAALIRRRVREQAILARAAKAHSPSWLLDPKVLGIAVEAGRSIGWDRIIPVAVLGFVVAQWARDYRAQDKQQP